MKALILDMLLMRMKITDNESARCWCTLYPTDDECDGVPEPELIRCVAMTMPFAGITLKIGMPFDCRVFPI